MEQATTKAFNLATGEELFFDSSVPAEQAALYAYMSQENRMSEFFSVLQNGGLNDLVGRYITHGLASVAAGDWCALTVPMDQAVTLLRDDRLAA